MFDFLVTGVNRVSAADFTEVYNVVMNECDNNDNSKDLHLYCKQVLKDFCQNRLCKEL